jgi:V8-like Glu-specific endopeptidase
MTAGHCIRTQGSCVNTKFVFNFAYKSMGYDPKFVDNDDVYSCQTLIHSELNANTDSDFALVKLDRPVVGRKPLTIRQKGRVQDADSLVVIGHPSGLATKVAAGAMVRSNLEDAYFVTNLDTYGGNSGSAVFNEQTGLVEGILVRGETDFKFTNGCYASNICDINGCRGEDVTRVTEVLAYVNASELNPIGEQEDIESNLSQSEQLHQ